MFYGLCDDVACQVGAAVLSVIDTQAVALIQSMAAMKAVALIQDIAAMKVDTAYLALELEVLRTHVHEEVDCSQCLLFQTERTQK